MMIVALLRLGSNGIINSRVFALVQLVFHLWVRVPWVRVFKLPTSISGNFFYFFILSFISIKKFFCLVSSLGYRDTDSLNKQETQWF